MRRPGPAVHAWITGAEILDRARRESKAAVRWMMSCRMFGLETVLALFSDNKSPKW